MTNVDEDEEDEEEEEESEEEEDINPAVLMGIEEPSKENMKEKEIRLPGIDDEANNSRKGSIKSNNSRNDENQNTSTDTEHKTKKRIGPKKDKRASTDSKASRELIP